MFRSFLSWIILLFLLCPHIVVIFQDKIQILYPLWSNPYSFLCTILSRSFELLYFILETQCRQWNLLYRGHLFMVGEWNTWSYYILFYFIPFIFWSLFYLSYNCPILCVLSITLKMYVSIKFLECCFVDIWGFFGNIERWYCTIFLPCYSTLSQ